MPHKTNKTASVLQLISGKKPDEIKNPIINKDFEEQVIHNIKQENDIVRINIVSELIDEWLPKVIKRFEICDSDKCKAEIMVEALGNIEPKYICINTDTDYEDVRLAKKEYTHRVVYELVKIAINIKKK